MPNVLEMAASVKLLLMDVDGVLTDGRLINVISLDIAEGGRSIAPIVVKQANLGGKE